MNILLLAVKDGALDAFHAPFAAPTTAHALRSFTTTVRTAAPDSPMATHPHDFELYQLGSYDDTTGHLLANLQRLARAIDLKEPQ